MPFLVPIAGCLFLLISLGTWERVRRNRAWKAVPIRIHVNGTRGKSSVTRLIWAALRAAGIPALAKTTGAAPCLLLPDGSEQPLPRRGKPNIREQLRTLGLAKRLGARAVVLECMAIAPDLQWSAEQDMVHATIGVITNARTDHTEVMGQTIPEIAASLGNTIPREAVLVVGEASLAETYERCARGRRSRIVVSDVSALPAEPLEPEPEPARQRMPSQPWQRENHAIALAVTRVLGIADSVAWPAMRTLPSWAGDAAQGTARLGHVRWSYLDARKANDPESFLQVWHAFHAGPGPAGTPSGPSMLIYNHRSDRPHRLLTFAAKAFPQCQAAELLVTGQPPAWTLWRALRRMRELPPLRFVPAPALAQSIAQRAAHCQKVVFCGNIQGLDLTQILPSPLPGA